jgi:hypothetical protein
MARLITRFLRKRRRIRESDASDEARSHLHNAVRAACEEGDFDTAHKIVKHLEQDGADRDEDEEDLEESDVPSEGDMDQEQTGRREGPEQAFGSQSGQKGMYSPGGKGNMESRYARHRQAGGGYRALQEGRKPSAKKVRHYAARLLKGD